MCRVRCFPRVTNTTRVLTTRSAMYTRAFPSVWIPIRTVLPLSTLFDFKSIFNPGVRRGCRRDGAEVGSGGTEKDGMVAVVVGGRGRAVGAIVGDIGRAVGAITGGAGVFARAGDTGVFAGTAVGMGVGVLVAVGVLVGLGVLVAVGVLVGEFVGEGVLVFVAVGVGVVGKAP